MQPDEGHDGRPGGEVLADRGLALDDGAVDRRDDRGVGELLAHERDLRAALEQHALAVLDLLDRVLVAPLGDLERRDRGVQLGPRHELLVPEPRQPVAVELGLVEQRLGLADDGGLRRVHPVVGPVRREPEPDARLLERGDRLVETELVVLGVDAGDPLALRTGLPRSTEISASRPTTLVPSTICSSAASVPVATIVRATAISVAGTTRTAGRGAGPAGAAAAGFWEAAVAGFSCRQPAETRPAATRSDTAVTTVRRARSDPGPVAPRRASWSRLATVVMRIGYPAPLRQRRNGDGTARGATGDALRAPSSQPAQRIFRNSTRSWMSASVSFSVVPAFCTYSHMARTVCSRVW